MFLVSQDTNSKHHLVAANSSICRQDKNYNIFIMNTFKQ